MNARQCQNCKKDIIPSNFMIHSIHCQRYFYICVKCQQLVRYNETDEHEIKYHVMVECDNCHSTLEMWHLIGHQESDCLYRDVQCSICSVNIKAVDIGEHEDYCGSRTEKCMGCNEFVMLKNKLQHVNSGHVFFKMPDEAGPSPSRKNTKFLLGDFIPDLTSGYQNNKKESKAIKSYDKQKKKIKESIQKNKDSNSCETSSEV